MRRTVPVKSVGEATSKKKTQLYLTLYNSLACRRNLYGNVTTSTTKTFVNLIAKNFKKITHASRSYVLIYDHRQQGY